MSDASLRCLLSAVTVGVLVACGHGHRAQPPRPVPAPPTQEALTDAGPTRPDVTVVRQVVGQIIHLDGSLAVVIDPGGDDGGTTDASADVQVFQTVARLAAPVDGGPLGPGEEVAHAIVPLTEPLRHCFDGLPGGGTPAASRSVWMTVDAHGRVATAGALPSAPGAANACVLHLLQSLQLSPRPGAPHWYSFPIASPTPSPR